MRLISWEVYLVGQYIGYYYMIFNLLVRPVLNFSFEVLLQRSLLYMQLFLFLELVLLALKAMRIYHGLTVMP